MKPLPQELYDRDYYAWILDQVRALRERRVEDVDWQNVAEEIEDLARSERRGLRSQMARLVEHLLKLEHARGIFRSYNTRGWRVSVRSARRQIRQLLSESPSLRLELPQLLAQAYEDGRLEALREPGLSEHELPDSCPGPFEQMMDDSFLPEAY